MRSSSSVAIVDDRRLLAEALAGAIREVGGHTVVGIALTGPQAISPVREEQPDVILADYHMPGYRGDELIARLLWRARASKLAGGHPLNRLGPMAAEAEVAARRADHAEAARLFGEVAGGIGSLGMWPATTTLVRLRAVELRAAFDRAGAQAELDSALENWRRAKATYYLGRLESWARSRGLGRREPGVRAAERETYPHRARARDRAAGGGGPHQQGDRRAARHQ